MFQPQMITTVLDWERRLEVEEQKPTHHRNEAYVNYLAAPQDCRKVERRSIFARLFETARSRQPVDDCYCPEPGREMQMG